MCTYNGEAYVKEQIDSILKQSHTDLHLYIQDDGSSDGTPALLAQYKTNDRVKLYLDCPHLGYPACFYDLLSKVPAYDLYAFSDQDDVWLGGKIKRAVLSLSKYDKNVPALLFSNYYVCDEHLGTKHISQSPPGDDFFLYTLYSCLGLGCTYVFNDAARKLVTEHQPLTYPGKDTWIGMCVSALGNVCFDQRPELLHRRHAGTTSPYDKGFLHVQKKRFETYFRGDGLKEVTTRMAEFRKIFANDLAPGINGTLSFFLNTKQRKSQRIKKAFYPKRLRYSLTDEIMLRLLFLSGRL